MVDAADRASAEDDGQARQSQGQAAAERTAVTQYELWWAELPPPAGRRPVLLLSRPPAYEFLNRFLAAEVTIRMRGIPQELVLGRREGDTVDVMIEGRERSWTIAWVG